MRRTNLNRESSSSLSGTWEFSIDPDDIGVEEEWYRPHATWKDAWAVVVPHSWQEEDALREYTGTGWYRTTFEATTPAVENTALLHFNAVDYEATVWVNGERVGQNADGYLPFRFDVTDVLADGTNTVAVRVHDPDDLSTVLHGKQGGRWYTRVSGIWQDVSFAVVPRTRVEAIRATPDLSDDTVDIAVDTTISPDNDPTDLVATVQVSRDERTVTAGECRLDIDGRGSTRLPLDDPVYWTPDDPVLYDVTVELAHVDSTIDTYEDCFGMRAIETTDSELLLNGEPLFVRGALDQAYYPDTFYRPSDLDLYEEEIRRAKELGFNMIRKHIKPAHPRFLELADRLGILVWEEPANPDVYTPVTREAVRAQFHGMVERDYNHPSVVIWSLYNEEWGIGYHPNEEPLWTDEEKQEYLESFYYEAIKADPTRLVCDNSGWAHVHTDINDYHEYFVVPDRADAWRRKLDHIVEHPEENYGPTDLDVTATPIVVSEFGTWGLPSVSALEAHYGGDPPWFHHDFLAGLKSPAGVRDRFDTSHLASVFDDLDDLADAWQERERLSISEQVVDMRTHEGISGYVITEFTDIEWEFNGVLDYLREPKASAAQFADVNRPVILIVEVESHAYWSGQTFRADLVIVNDTATPVSEAVRWEIFGETGTVDVTVDPFSVGRVRDAVTVTVPDVEQATTGTVSANGTDLGILTETAVLVVPAEQTASADIPLYVDQEPLHERLEEQSWIVDDISTAKAAIVTSLDDETRRFAASGGAVILVPDADGDVVETDEFSLTVLPAEESWNLCASFVWQTLLPGVERVPGWAFEDLYPLAYVDSLDPDDNVSVGYTEGWLAVDGGIAVARPYGDGHLAICTLQVSETYGSHPTGTAVLSSFLRETV